MNRLSAFAGKSGALRTDTAVRIAGKTVKQLMSFVSAMLLASVNTAQMFAPLGTAFAACVKREYLISACFGAAAGYILTQDSLPSLRYVCALLCCAVLRELFSRFDRISKFRLLEGLVSFMTLFMTGVTVMTAGGINMKSFALVLAESVIGFAATCFFADARDSFSALKKHGAVNTGDFTTATVCVFALLLAVSEITVFHISFARIAVCLSILLICHVAGDAGISAAVGAGLIFSADRAAGSSAFIYCAAALFFTKLRGSNKYIRTVAFFAAYAFIYALSVGSWEKGWLVTETGIGCIIFVLLPEKLYAKIRKLFFSQSETQINRFEKQAVLSRLDCAAAAVNDISGFIGSASQMLSCEGFGDTVQFYSAVRDRVCSGCSHFSLCWGRNFSDCKRSFDKMSEMLKNNYYLRADNLPPYLAGCCVRKEELSESFNRNYLEYSISKSMQQKVEQIRLITGEQFSGVYGFLGEIADELSESVRFDRDISERVAALLKEDYSVTPVSAVCTLDSRFKHRIEIILTQKLPKLNQAQFRKAVEQVSGVELAMPYVVETDGKYALIFCEKTDYRVQAAASRICADGEDVCGDSYEGFYDTYGNYYAVLSDGMGTGFHAAVDSSLTCSMAARLLKAGFSCKNTLNLVNSAMLLKSARESLATLDVIRINLYSGDAEFFKAGACQSLVKQNNSISCVSIPSMPLGILRKADFAGETFELDDGDMVLLGSDGAFEYSESSVTAAFAVSRSESVQEITQRVLMSARRAREGMRSDDITVIALRLSKND